MSARPRGPAATLAGWGALATLCGAVLLPGNARADDDNATAYAKSALDAAESMYLETDFEGAEELLGAAAARCAEEGCEAAVHARVHVFRAEVLVSGIKDRPAAKRAMRAALEVAPTLKLDPNLDSQALIQLYGQAKAELEREGPKARKPRRPRSAEPPDDDDDAAVDIRRNWIRATFMVDLALLLAEDGVCGQGDADRGWVCTRLDDSRYQGIPATGQQNATEPSLQLSTLRAALGYERLLGDNFTLGLRLGVAFRPVVRGSDEGFVPFHGEGRVAYWFGSQPFASVVRPNLFAALGFGPVITPFELTVVEDGNACGAVDPISGDCTVPTDPNRESPEPRVQRLAANKTSGQGFGSLGLGLSFSPTPLLMLDLAVRATATFPVFSPVFSPEAGLSFGF